MSARCPGCQAISTAPKVLREIAGQLDGAIDSAVAEFRAAAQGLRVLADAVSARQPGDVARALETTATRVRGLQSGDRLFRALSLDLRLSSAVDGLDDLARRVRGGSCS